MSGTADEWRNRSLDGEVCAIVFCSNPPTNQCPKCNIHYCYEHIILHMHEVAEDEIANEKDDIQKLR